MSEPDEETEESLPTSTFAVCNNGGDSALQTHTDFPNNGSFISDIPDYPFTQLLLVDFNSCNKRAINKIKLTS